MVKNLSCVSYGSLKRFPHTFTTVRECEIIFLGEPESEKMAETSGNGVLRVPHDISRYSRVHKSWNSFFSKILEKPSIVQKKMLPYIKVLDFSQR